jgi:hypothetical protein
VSRISRLYAFKHAPASPPLASISACQLLSLLVGECAICSFAVGSSIVCRNHPESAALDYACGTAKRLFLSRRIAKWGLISAVAKVGDRPRHKPRATHRGIQSGGILLVVGSSLTVVDRRISQRVASILTCPRVDATSAYQTGLSSRVHMCIMRCGSCPLKPAVMQDFASLSDTTTSSFDQ